MEQSDLNNYKMLKSIIHSGKFEVKGDAIEQVASLLIWFDKLETKIMAGIKMEPVIKTLDDEGDSA